MLDWCSKLDKIPDTLLAQLDVIKGQRREGKGGAGLWNQGQLTGVQATICNYQRLLTFGGYDDNGSNKDNPSKWFTLSALGCELEIEQNVKRMGKNGEGEEEKERGKERLSCV